MQLVAGPVLVAVGVATGAGYLGVGTAGTFCLAMTALLLVAGVSSIVTGTTQKCPADRVVGLGADDSD